VIVKVEAVCLSWRAEYEYEGSWTGASGRGVGGWWASRGVLQGAFWALRVAAVMFVMVSVVADCGVGHAWIGLVISQFVLGIIIMRCDLDVLYDLPTWLAQSQYLSTPFRSPVTSFDVSRGCHCTARTGESPAWILCHILHVFQSQKQT
jgi:hypothetical protein